jgi:PKHD-type hydroxylase
MSVFTPDECKKIIELGNSLTPMRGSVGDEGVISDQIRKCSVSWIYPNPDTNWIFRIMTDAVLAANSTYFNFHITGFQEGFQFTKYEESEEKYTKHVDKMLNGRIRKLSVSIQLSDPADYEGGEFLTYLNEHGEPTPTDQGLGLFFPSYALHEVKPVTKGTRYSLVGWVTGDNFR